MSITLINKTPKVNYYGIEVDPEITWNGWEPGNKYTKKLILKNVKFVTQKLNFSVPAKEVFTTTFPKTITLSAGTSFCLPITFKPHKKDVFEDKIDFQTTDGEVFTVPVKALLPEYQIEMPEKISCGIVAAHDSANIVIIVTNKSELETSFKWRFAEPYEIEPSDGVLQPFESRKFTVYFKPVDVSTYQMSIPFLYGDERLGNQKLLTVTSVAKYPSVSIIVDDMDFTGIMNEDGQIVVDFGTVSVGSKSIKQIRIENVSEVNTSVEISRDDITNPIDWVFSCPVRFRQIPAGTRIETSHKSVIKSHNLLIPIEYHPKISFADNVENFIIKVSNKCATFKLKCIGKADGPSVTVSHTFLNFFQLNLGEIATQPIILTNNSRLTAIPFQFVLDSSISVFHIDKCNGIIKPQDNIQIVLTFRPQNPIQYYRKVVCLVPDQEPIFIDILGTCHDMYTQPHILQLKHLKNFKQRQIDGLSFFSPEILNLYVQNNSLAFDEDSNLKVIKDEMESLCEKIPLLNNWKEYFFSNNDTDIVFSTPYVGQDQYSIYFEGLDYVDKKQIHERLLSGTLDSSDVASINERERKFSLKNNTKGMLTIQWTNLPESIRKDIFSILPLQMDISPQETVIFTLRFSPDGPDRIYGAELEAFAYFKSQRQFELTKEEFISPPFCVLLRCTGHSFAKNQQNFLPKFQFDQAQVVFPSVNLNETAFRSLTLTNKGEEPMIFNLQKLGESFSIKPTVGQILPGFQQIFAVRFEPLAIQQYLSSIDMQLNSRADFVEDIPVLGSADRPVVCMDNDSQIFFSPTNIGNISTQRYSIKNTSRIPLKFEWKLRPSDAFVIRVYPKNGLLLPNEILTQKWFFSPKTSGRIVIKALLIVQGITPSAKLTDPQYFTLRIIGQAEEANLAVIGSNHLGFDPLVVGSSAYKTFCLINPGEATVYYQLYINTIDNKTDEDGSCSFEEIDRDNEDKVDIQECITIKDSKGVLPGRCKKTVYVSVSPKQRRSYKLRIGYALVDNDSLELDYLYNGNQYPENKSALNRINKSNDDLVTVSMTGVFPTLQITDVQGTGPSQWLSKLNLWKNLSLDNFNVCLDSDPTTSELIFTMGTRASHFRPVPVSTRALIDMNLGAAPHNSDSTEIRLMFENCGFVETKLAFLFPQDLEIELEYWAETGEYSEEELHQMKIRDNELFDIQPRKATVKVGESVTVCITYNHWVVGTDRLPVLLKLDRGRELLLNLTGVTLHLERPYIHFPNNKHLFNPTPIGLLKTPIQYYDLYNPSAMVVHFELDLSPLKKLMEENYNIPILQCLNPVGDILPGQTFRLEWAFIPIEPKTYIVEVPFHISDSVCLKIQFTAIGYDQRYLGDTINPDQGLPGESGVPSVQSISLPNQDARLSIERISLGNVPTFICLRRVVFLNNTSTTKNLTFSWNVTNSEDANYIYVYPQNGLLMAKESILCHVTFHTRNVPKFFDINLICEIYDQSKIIEFREELRKWEEEEKRRNVEFTISDTGKQQSNLKKCLNGKNGPEIKKSSTPSYLPPVTKPVSSQNNGQKNSSSNTQKSILSSEKSISELKDSSLWFKPQMPKPFLLRLGISGRSCNIEEFQKDYPDSYSRYCLDKPFMMETACPLSVLQSESSPNFPIEANLKEHVTMELILSDILGGIIEDAEFLDAVKNIREEAVPFYSQLPGAKIAHMIDTQEGPDTNIINKDTLCVSPEFEEITNESVHSPTNESVIVKSGSEQSEKSPVEPPKEPIDEQKILDSLSFGSLIESVMENMIVNILCEANAREVDLTCRPRLIALPPRSARPNYHDNVNDNDNPGENK